MHCNDSFLTKARVKLEVIITTSHSSGQSFFIIVYLNTKVGRERAGDIAGRFRLGTHNKQKNGFNGAQPMTMDMEEPRRRN